MRVLSLPVVLLAAAGTREAVSQSVSFLLPQYIPIGPGCCSVLTGDFNSDGKMDIAVAHGNPGFTVLLGNGEGTFTRKDIPQVVGSSIGLGLAADLNSDGILDILAVVDTGLNPPSSDRLAYRNVVFLGNGMVLSAPPSSTWTAAKAY